MVHVLFFLEWVSQQMWSKYDIISLQWLSSYMNEAV